MQVRGRIALIRTIFNEMEAVLGLKSRQTIVGSVNSRVSFEVLRSPRFAFPKVASLCVVLSVPSTWAQGALCSTDNPDASFYGTSYTRAAASLLGWFVSPLARPHLRFSRSLPSMLMRPCFVA